MKLKYVKNAKYKNKWYYKYQIDLPKSLIKKLGWDKATYLRFSTNGNNLILKPQKKAIE